MVGSSLVLSDNSLLSKIDRYICEFEKSLALLSGAAVFILMLLAVFSVGGRNFFNQPLSGYVDWIEQFMPLIAFMGIAFVHREGGHVRMDMIIGSLQGRVLYLAEFITTFAILVLMLLLVIGSWAHFERSFDFSSPLWSRDSSMDIALPIWPAKLLVPFAFGTLCLRLIIHLWAFGRALILNDERVVAIPTAVDPAKKAALETEYIMGRDNKVN